MRKSIVLALLLIFHPRVGGILCITTKSKKFLAPIIQRYQKDVEVNRKEKKNGEIYIR